MRKSDVDKLEVVPPSPDRERGARGRASGTSLEEQATTRTMTAKGWSSGYTYSWSGGGCDEYSITVYYRTEDHQKAEGRAVIISVGNSKN